MQTRFYAFLGILVLVLLWVPHAAQAKTLQGGTKNIKHALYVAGKMRYEGMAVFNHGIKLPMHTIYYDNQTEDEVIPSEADCGGKACQFAFTVPPVWANDLKLVKLEYMNWVLVPNNMQVQRADIGLSTSSVLVLGNAQLKLTAYNSGVCNWCGVPDILVLFKNARVLLGDSYPDSHVDLPSFKKLRSVNKTPNIVLYQYESKTGKEVHGVAKFDNDEALNIRSFEVELHDKKAKKLAGILLNFQLSQM